MCIVIICLPLLDVIKYEIDLSYQAVFLHDQKIRTKFKYRENEKSFNKKHFSSFIKGFQLPQVVSDPRVGL